MNLPDPLPFPDFLLALVAAIYLALAAGGVLTNIPWCDEAWFASPAMNLATEGYMGTSVLDPTATWNVRYITGIDHFTYWIMPLYPVLQAAWQLVAGSSLFSVRIFSVLWGAAALAGWYFLVRKLSGSSWAGFLTAAFLATDFEFLWSASTARMDMMCAALGVGGLAAYVCLRDRNLKMAILAGNTCVAASGLTHPIGLGYLVGLVVLVVYFDHSRIRPTHLALAAAPYLAGAAAWGWYIAQNPYMFLAQFGGNIGGRLISGNPLDWLRRQLVGRYLYQYGWAPDTRGLSHIKVVVLVVYAAGLGGSFFSREIRQDPGGRALLLLWAALAVSISVVDKQILSVYMVHLIMPLAAILAVWMVWALRTRKLPRWLPGLLVGVLTVTQAAVLFSRYRSNQYARQYLPAAAFLKSHSTPGGVIMGSAELAFQLGFHGDLVDDYRLGYRSGKRPSVVVLDKSHYQAFITGLRQEDPAAYRYASSLLEHDFNLAYENPAYRIYVRAR
jgi:4-amino-4-deoxy-L-arabinose transferase-like glycosyltransferase